MQFYQFIDYEAVRAEIKAAYHPTEEEGTEARNENTIQEMELLQSIALERGEAMYTLIFLENRKIESNYPRQKVGEPPLVAPLGWATTVDQIQDLIEAIVDEDDKERAAKLDLQNDNDEEDREDTRSIDRSSAGQSTLSRQADKGWQRSATKVRSLEGPMKDHFKKLQRAGVPPEAYCLSHQELCEQYVKAKRVLHETNFGCRYCKYISGNTS